MDATLDVVKREGRGKNESRRLRAAGRIPGRGLRRSARTGKLPEGVPVAVDPKEVLHILHSESGANTLITLKLDGGESRVMVKEYQLDPVTHQLLHADFYQLAMDRAITVTVPILIMGEPKGAKLQGGMLDFVTRELQVQCLPTDIPEHIDIDVSGADAPPGRPAARPAGEPEVEAAERPGHDARPRRPAEGRGGGGAGGGARRRPPRLCGGARGHQEGQDGQGRGARRSSA